MAGRFGGKYSPDPGSAENPAPTPPGAEPKPAPEGGDRIASALFLLAPLPFFATAFFGDAAALARDLGAGALLLLAVWLTREGLAAEAAYRARTAARRPALPRKLLGSVLTGAALFLAANTGLAPALILGLIGAALHLGAFGPDPLTDKGMSDIDRHQSDRVARVLAAAEKHLAAMHEAAAGTGERALVRRVETFQNAARTLFRTVETDPGDLTAARRHLGVYLQGARDATLAFAGIWRQNRDPTARADFEALLDDLEKGFGALNVRLLENDRTGLDVEIGVLRERLKREGLTLDEKGDEA